MPNVPEIGIRKICAKRRASRSSVKKIKPRACATAKQVASPSATVSFNCSACALSLSNSSITVSHDQSQIGRRRQRSPMASSSSTARVTATCLPNTFRNKSGRRTCARLLRTVLFTMARIMFLSPRTCRNSPLANRRYFGARLFQRGGTDPNGNTQLAETLL